MSESRDQPRSDTRARIAATRDVATAEHWCEVLENAGIDGLVELDDERAAMPAQNPLVGEGGSPSTVVYSVTVPEGERPRAMAVLNAYLEEPNEAGDREEMSMATMLRGALIVVGAVILFFAFLAITGTIE